MLFPAPFLFSGGGCVTNEELAALIQAGDRDRLMELWQQVRRMVYKQAARLPGWGGATTEDLIQAGFIAMLLAVDSYDPAKAKFSTYLFQWLRAEFSAAAGQHTKLARLDPIHNAVSLDQPLEDEEDATLSDFISDPAATAEMESMDVRLGVAAVLAELPEEQQKVIHDKYWNDLPVDAKTHAAALRRLRHPDCSKRLKAYL